jgi:hypothetical protein
VHWEGLSQNEESDSEISDIDSDFFDEADYTVDKLIEHIQLNWKSNVKKNLSISVKINSAYNNSNERNYKIRT